MSGEMFTNINVFESPPRQGCSDRQVNDQNEEKCVNVLTTVWVCWTKNETSNLATLLMMGVQLLNLKELVLGKDEGKDKVSLLPIIGHNFVSLIDYNLTTCTDNDFYHNFVKISYLEKIS